MNKLLVKCRLSLMVLAGCGRVGFDPLGGGDDGGIDDDGNGSASGSGTISGTPAACLSFSSVKAAYVVGTSQVVGQTSIYVFNSAIPCSQLDVPNWDYVIPNGTCTLELVAGGTSPTTYTIAGAPPPTIGMAGSTVYSSTGGGSIVQAAMTGTLQLMAAAADGSIAGSFDVHFTSARVLTGTFVAAACASGRYP